MCTVTLVKTSPKGFILTSNRDEAIHRKTLPINNYTVAGKELIFPKDELAGGTWIAASDEQSMICLLNGGYKNHIKQSNYRHSRGIVVTDILSENNLKSAMQNYNCEGLEPFTLVGVNWSHTLEFYEVVWDGTIKNFQVLDPNKTLIWSSSTLYSDEMKAERKKWFEDFTSQTKITPESIINFHKTAGKGDDYYDLQIKRGNLQTRSITQVVANDNEAKMTYEDLINKQSFEKIIETINI